MLYFFIDVILSLYKYLHSSFYIDTSGDWKKIDTSTVKGNSGEKSPPIFIALKHSSDSA